MTSTPGGAVYDGFVKRPIDVVLAALGLIALSPVLIATALGVRLKLGRPVLFRQVRPGRHGRPFELVKFRSMTDARDERGAPRPDAGRLPPFGRFLRASSLDELPELWNVLVGDMSLVGPRPLLAEYLTRYSPVQARRHDVRPGITGWAQVNGRNALSWEARFELDLWYVDHVSFRVDIEILWRTAVRLVRPQGIAHEGEATMARFLGSPEAEASQ